MSMLVLSRKIGERVLLPDLQITITVVAIEGNTVRVGIAAPAEIPVYREEVWRRIQSQTQPQTDAPKDVCPETLAEL
jgi:carbon storage regulator